MIFTSTLGSPQHKNRETVSNTPYMVSATEYTPLRSKQSATKRWGTDNVVVPASMSTTSMGFSSF